MKGKIRIAAGAILFLAVLWVGCWLEHIMPKDDWRNFPLFITCASLGIVSVVIFAVGVIDET